MCWGHVKFVKLPQFRNISNSIKEKPKVVQETVPGMEEPLHRKFFALQNNENGP